MLFQEIRRKIQITNKERKNSPWYRHISPFQTDRTFPSEKASPSLLRRLRKASLAVETVAVLPVFLFAMITVSGLLDLPAVQSTHLLAACEEAKKAGSQETESEITTIQRSWSYRPVSLLAPFPEITFVNEIRAHSWCGREKPFGDGTGNVTMVYITEHGSVFHRDSSCTYIHLSVEAVSGREVENLRNLSGNIYHACEVCSRLAQPAETVYITESGTRYHNDGTCSSLKRSVRLAAEEEVQGLRPCSRCGEEE